MAHPTTFTEADLALMVGIFAQTESKIDNEKLRIHLGLSTKNMAAVRLCRFRAKLAKMTATSPTATAPKRSNGEMTRLPKKRKLGSNEEGNDIKDEGRDGESADCWKHRHGRC